MLEGPEFSALPSRMHTLCFLIPGNFALATVFPT